jgi:hypothetical protein
MKKLILFLAFFAATGLTMQAQTAKKSCAQTCSKAKTAKTTAVKASLEEATLAASTDENIEKRVCAESGAVSFAKKSVCSVSGKVSFDEVQYDSATKAFVNVSPSEMHDSETAVKASMEAKPSVKAKACCSKECAKACCAGKTEKTEKTDKT